jgi:hypothetical protein
MNRTVKDATVKTFHNENLDSIKAHVLAFVTAYILKHLKALKWRTPFQSICDAWKANPSAFKINPHHLMPGPHPQPEGYLVGWCSHLENNKRCCARTFVS